MINAAAQDTYLHTRLSLFQSRLKDISWFEGHVEKPETDVHDLLDELNISFDHDSSRLHSSDGSIYHKTILNEYLILLRPLTCAPRRLLALWMKHLELKNLKTILRGVLRKRPIDEICGEIIDLGTLATLPFEKLLHSDDVPELLRILDKTPYAAMSRQARRLFEQHNDPFFVDASIDQRYYSDIASTISLVSKSDKALLQPLLGSIIDQQNLLWLLRYRFTYNLSPAETWYLLIAGGYRLTSSRLLSLVRLESTQEVIEQLPVQLSDLLNDAKGIFCIEQRMNKLVEDVAWRMLKQRQSAITRAMAWLVLREKQLVRIRALIKGHRLSLSPSLIRVGMGLEER